jgi:hypothetical protein
MTKKNHTIKVTIHKKMSKYFDENINNSGSYAINNGNLNHPIQLSCSKKSTFLPKSLLHSIQHLMHATQHPIDAICNDLMGMPTTLSQKIQGIIEKDENYAEQQTQKRQNFCS